MASILVVSQPTVILCPLLLYLIVSPSGARWTLFTQTNLNYLTALITLCFLKHWTVDVSELLPFWFYFYGLVSYNHASMIAWCTMEVFWYMHCVIITVWFLIRKFSLYNFKCNSCLVFIIQEEII